MSDDEGLSNALRESLLQPALAELPSELAEELEACLAIWGDEDAHLFVYEPPITAPATPPNSKTSRFVLSTKIQSLHEQLKINILIALPSDYPTTSPPLLQLQDRYLASHPVSDKLFSSILRIYMHKRIDGRSTFPDAGGVEFIPGEVCLYEGVEEVKRLCEEFIVESGKVSQQLKLIREGVEGYRIGAGESLDHLEDVVVPPTRQANEFRQVDFDEGPCPTIVSSEPILDRRSVFIGHCAAISSPNEVSATCQTLFPTSDICFCRSRSFCAPSYSTSAFRKLRTSPCRCNLSVVRRKLMNSQISVIISPLTESSRPTA